MRFNEEEVDELIHANEGHVLTTNPSIIVIAVVAQWVSAGKYEEAEVIIKNKANQRYYSVTAGRAGSHFTHYDYMYELEATEVSPHRIEVIDWRPVLSSASMA